MGGCSDSGEQGMLRVPELSAAPAHSPGGGDGGKGHQNHNRFRAVCFVLMFYYYYLF